MRTLRTPIQTRSLFRGPHEPLPGSQTALDHSSSSDATPLAGWGGQRPLTGHTAQVMADHCPHCSPQNSGHSSLWQIDLWDRCQPPLVPRFAATITGTRTVSCRNSASRHVTSSLTRSMLLPFGPPDPTKSDQGAHFTSKVCSHGSRAPSHVGFPRNLPAPGGGLIAGTQMTGHSKKRSSSILNNRWSHMDRNLTPGPGTAEFPALSSPALTPTARLLQASLLALAETPPL